MLASQRQEEILRQLESAGAVVVKELAQRFDVTEDCIRKDLALLERRGQLKRTYGGAMPARRNLHSFGVAQRSASHVAEKQAIADRAFALIQDGDTVFLDISTVSLELAKRIFASKKQVTVVSTMLAIINLAAEQKARFLSVGGQLEPNCNGFAGSMANAMIERFRFDLAFFGTAGADAESGAVYTYVAEDGDTKAVALRNSRRAYLLCEARKFRQDGNYRFADIGDFAGMIMDQKPDADVEAACAALGVEILCA